ncbi:MAG TPA: hypothetical protein VK034_19330 [Enhygromyxa sp.]|nr:hypothetical protein [Enhygromyxa sp.]
MTGPRSLLGGLLGLAAVSLGCYDGKFLALEPCASDRDCGRGMACIDGVCGGYSCPVDEVDGECPCPGRPKYECAELSYTRSNKVDILFVIDNTDSIAQHGLLRLIGDLRPVLDTRLIDYRVAITTTDIGNPFWCQDASAERGEFVFSSCRERLDDFQVDGIDVREQCLANCKHDVITTVPSVASSSGELASRPWLEVRPYGTNLPAYVTVDEALQCAILQGIDGCQFEAHLESLALALDGAYSPESANFGFLRPEAHLMVVIFTNAADCSYNEAHSSIFDPAGDRVFWADPGAESPSSALCWNAGVECLGGPTPYYDCLAVTKDSSGALTLDQPNAVLHPIQRYLDRIEAIRAIKRERNEDLEVFVELIAGVPEGYDQVPLVYSSVADSDPEFEAEFGIGPGCVPEIDDPELPPVAYAAVPPARLLAFAEATRPSSGIDNVFSYCEDEYLEAFTGISSVFDATIPALCMPVCVEDEGTCQLVHYENGQSIDIPRCALDSQQLPALDGEQLCFYSLVGPAASDECREQGWNVQFGFLNADGVDIPKQVYAACAPADSNKPECST